MNDLINGRDLLSSQHTDLCYGIACKDCSMCTEDGGCRVEEWIDKFPSADRPQGKWKAKSPFDYFCNNCGFSFDIRKCDFLENMKYCPNCGVPKGADDDDEV